MERWIAAPPRGPFAGFAAAVKVRIAGNGTLKPVLLLRSSGSRTYDDSCLAALAATARVQPPPSLIIDRASAMVMVLEFEGMPPGGAARVYRTFDVRHSRVPERMEQRVLSPAFARAQAETQGLPRVSALRRVAEPSALVKVSVTATGKVSRVTVVKSGGPALDRAARADLAGWTFRPYKLAGEPVPFCFMLRLTAGG
jgi:TonB family protein